MNGGRSDRKLRIAFLFRILNVVQRWELWPGRWRAPLLSLMGIRIGTRSFVNWGVSFGGRHLTLGEGVFINQRVLIDAAARVEIQDGVHVAPGVMILTSTHEIGHSGQRAGAPLAKPVILGAGCWIGAQAIILPGVSVAPGCIIAAGAIVTRDTAPDGLYAGNPARRLRDL